jgi:predicted nucleotidyltransferase
MNLNESLEGIKLQRAVIQAGFPFANRLLHLFAGGSNQHGARIPGKNDLDIAGVFIEPPLFALGIDKFEHFVTSTGEEHEKNTPDDVDVALYSLRKWAFLAAKGNPTVLSYLFMPCSFRGVWNDVIVLDRHVFLASSHAKAFLGMGDNQYRRLRGELGSGKHGQRENPLGWDTKAGMHMIRMMHECLEMLTEGTMTFPRPEVDVLLDIRQGKWTRQRVESEYLELRENVTVAEQKSSLPRTVSRSAISQVVAEAYLRYYKEREEMI